MRPTTDGSLERQVAQPARAVRQVPEVAVEHRHRDRGVRHDLPQLLALALDRLLQQLALGDVARHRVEPHVAAALAYELGALAEPEIRRVGRRHGELAVAHRDALLALVLVESARLLAVVGAHDLEEGPAHEARRLRPQELAGGGVGVRDAAQGVDAEDDVVRALDQRPEVGLAQTQPDENQHGDRQGGGCDDRGGEARRHSVSSRLLSEIQ